MAAAADSSPRRSRAWSSKLAAGAQEFVDFGEAGAELFGFELQQAFAGLRGVAFGFEVGGVLRELLVLGFALEFFGGGGFDLRGQRVDALSHLGEERLDALQDGGGRAMALFERGYAGGVMGCGLGGFFTALAESGQAIPARRRFAVRAGCAVLPG